MNGQTVLIENEVVTLRKGLFGWHVIYPIKNKDGSINWKNLIAGGSWWKLGLVILFVILAIGAINEYVGIAKIANECLQGGNQWMIKI